MVIIFAPGYDVSTRANLTIARRIKLPNCQVLFEAEATKEMLLMALSQSDQPLLVMSHGIPKAVKAQHGEIALSKNEVNLLNRRTVYAYTCYTAAQLGRDAAHQGSIWWGYSELISCAINSPRLISIFTNIFTFIRDNFHKAKSKEDRQRVLEELKNLCATAEEKVDLIYADTETTDILELYMTLQHLWNRLRIWAPGAAEPEQHPHSSSPSLPWG